MEKKHNGAVHHHRKAEMEHHKVRESHKSAHHAKKVGHHAIHPKMHEHAAKGYSKNNSPMIDNRHVNDNHQEGISRIIQRKGDMEVGQHGKMGMGHSTGSFKRSTVKSLPTRG